MSGLTVAVLALAAMGLLTTTVGLHGVLWLDLLTVNLSPGYWELGPVRFDLTDLAMGFLIVGLIARRVQWRSIAQIPHLHLWFALGVLISAAYLVSPINQRHLDAPHEVAYQLFRYCWRQILFYPLVMLLLSDPKRIRGTFIWIAISGTLLALQAIPEGYLGTRFRAAGPFESGNALGGALAPALVVCAGLALQPGRGRGRILSLVAAVLVLRALVFTGSRGALVAAAAGLIALAVQLLPLQALRPRLFQFAGAGVIAALLLLSVNPSIVTEAPSLRRFSMASSSAGSTLEWRMQERWPHFTRIALDNPWLGAGIVVDPSLGGRGATPHNGYLAIAVLYGLPVVGLFLFFSFMALRAAFRIARSGVPPPVRFLTGISAAALVSLLLHNMIDSILLLEYGARYFWIFVTFCLAAERARAAGAMRPAIARPRRQPTPGMATRAL